jgi:Glycosyl transferases group 1
LGSVCRGCVVSHDPLVVLSSINEHAPLGIASVLPELFTGRPSLQLISPAWSLAGNYDFIQRQTVNLFRVLPEAEIVFLANEESELFELQARGLVATLASTHLFGNEHVFKPMEGIEKKYDAIYNAVFMPFKNHHLCEQVDSLALLHYFHTKERKPEQLKYEKEVEKKLKHSTILNHDESDNYNFLSWSKVAQSLNSARVGLCLSSREGAMRACAEYLLCGLPVVSVPAIGGRMRYLNASNSRIVPEDPAAVARAVQELVQLNLNPLAIRRDFLNIIEFERRNFVAFLNQCAESFFGVQKLVSNFKPFNEALHYRNVDGWRALLSAR